MATDTLETQDSSYDPNRLLDKLKEILNLDSDVALSQVLDVPPPLISQIRHRGYPVGPSILIRMHDVTKLSVQELRDIMGDRRKKIRSGYDTAFIPEFGRESDSESGSNSKQLYFYALVIAVLFCVFWTYVFR